MGESRDGELERRAGKSSAIGRTTWSSDWSTSPRKAPAWKSRRLRRPEGSPCSVVSVRRRSRVERLLRGFNLKKGSDQLLQKPGRARTHQVEASSRASRLIRQARLTYTDPSATSSRMHEATVRAPIPQTTACHMEEVSPGRSCEGSGACLSYGSLEHNWRQQSCGIKR